MDLKSKVETALRRSLRPEYLHLENEQGISGFVVSAQFHRLPALKRQQLIYQALHGSSLRFTKRELGQVLAIAGLRPAEFEALGYQEGQSRR